MPKENQPDSTKEAPVETEEVEQPELSEEEQVEQVKALLSEETEPEPTPEPEPEPEPEAEPEPEKIVESILSDEMIEKYPSLKALRGKSLKELAPVYDKLVRKYQNEIRENKELKGKLSKTSLQELGSPPDPIENPKEFKDYQDKRDELIRKQTRDEMAEVKPTVNPLQEVKERLPDVDIEKLADEWAKFNARRLFDSTGNLKPEIQKMYQEDPDLMTDEIINFYDLSSKANQNEFQIEKKATEKTYEKTKANFKEARKTKKEASQVNAVSRNVELTSEDVLLTNILKLVEEEQ